MTMPFHELAALAAALCWALTGLFAADAVRALGPYRFNLIRQLFIAALLALTVLISGTWAQLGWHAVWLLALSGLIGLLLGDTFNFTAVDRLGPRRAGAIFALNAPMAAVLGWALLGESLGLRAGLGIALTATGVAVAILGRPRSNAHRFEQTHGRLAAGVICGLLAALGQAGGSLIARPVMEAGLDPWAASLVRVGVSGLAMGLIAMTPLIPPSNGPQPARIYLMTCGIAVLGLFVGMTLFLFALQGEATGIIATLSATSPVIILPLLWLRTGQRPTATSWLGAAIAMAGLALIFTR